MTSSDDSQGNGLAAQRDTIARELAHRLVDGTTPLSELKALQERLRLFDSVIADPAALQRTRQRVLWASIGAVALLLSAAAWVPMPTVPFRLELVANAATLEMAGADEMGAQMVAGELRLDGFSTVDSGAAELVQLGQADHPRRITIRADSTLLRRIAWSAASTLRLDAGRPAVRIGVEATKGLVLAEVELAGPTQTDFGLPATRRSADYGPGEWLRLASGDASAPDRRPPPLDLTLARRADTSYDWQGLRPVALRFVERQNGAGVSARLVSSLVDARITLPATAAEVRLVAGDGLELDGLVLERCELSLGATLKLQVVGSARRIETRSGAFERSLKPSVLEFVARHHLIGLLWGSAAFMWGALSWLRKQFGPSP